MCGTFGWMQKRKGIFHWKRKKWRMLCCFFFCCHCDFVARFLFVNIIFNFSFCIHIIYRRWTFFSQIHFQYKSFSFISSSITSFVLQTIGMTQNTQTKHHTISRFHVFFIFFSLHWIFDFCNFIHFLASTSCRKNDLKWKVP